MFRFSFVILIICTANFIIPNAYCKQQVPKTSAFQKQSSLVVDCSNKKPIVLYNNSANEIRHPASLTKLMTIYLLLEAIQNKKVTFNTKFKVSKFAAQQMASKLHLKVGSKISVLDCIKALLVKSANDVAVVVAEGLSGSVPAFCKLMNKKAKLFGMKHTHYENPSGVPNTKQITCANDIAILGLSILNKFPKYWHLFSIKNFTYNNKKYNTHCKILNWYRAADGAKTGYVCASGYNLWVTATKFNKEGKSKRLCAIIFGEKSGRERDFKAARLLDNYFGDYTLLTCKNKVQNNKSKKEKKIEQINTKKTDKKKTIKKLDSNKINKNQINNKPKETDTIIYELESFPMDDIIKSSGKSKEYFDDLYKDDVPLQVESSTPIDFTTTNNNKLSNNRVSANNKYNRKQINTMKLNKKQN